MEQKQNRIAPEALADESASPFNFRQDRPPAASEKADPPLLSDCLDETLDEIFPPGSRKPRHDGWTPEAIAGFLHALAATGVVDHAARAVGLSAASAYAFRNRRQGRAFARMWDAVLVHRARARIASELQARAIAGCVSVRKKDGEVVSEYHYYDNRLAMSLLTRLDRLAERETASDAQLRALSEDLDDYVECVAAGEDADAFVDARRPAEPDAAPTPAPEAPDDDPDLTEFARLSGCSDYRDANPCDIEVLDLDPLSRGEWTADQWVRAFRSGFMTWLDAAKEDDPDSVAGCGAAMHYHFTRAAARAAARAPQGPCDLPEGEALTIDTSDLDLAAIRTWTDHQLARAWETGLFDDITADFWDELADAERAEE